MSQERKGMVESYHQPWTFRLGRDFLLVWVGQVVSMLGDQFGSMALSILILQQTGSATAMSLNIILSILPVLIFGPAAGIILDRVDRKRVLVTADILRGMLTLGLGWVIYTGRFSLIYSYSWSIALSMIRVLYDPGKMALIPSLVPSDQLQRANALQTSGVYVAGIVGPTAAAFAVANAGPWFALTANATTFGISALCMSLAHSNFEKTSVRTSNPKISEIRDGFEFFRNTRLASTLLATMIIVNACSQPSGLALNYHIINTLKANVEYLGIIGSSSAVMSLLASAILASRPRWTRFGRMISLAICGSGLCYVLASVAPTMEILTALFALSGFAGPLLQVSVQTLYQDITPNEIRGRVFALRGSLSQALSPVFFAVAGPLLDILGSRVVFAVLGVILLVTSLVVGTRKEVRDI